MEEKENIFDNSLFAPIKQELGETIDRLMKAVLLLDKKAEVTLKISLDKETKGNFIGDTYKSWKEPAIEYKIIEKIKEYNTQVKASVGFNYQISISENDEIIIEEQSKQESLFDEKEDQ